MDNAPPFQLRSRASFQFARRCCMLGFRNACLQLEARPSEGIGTRRQDEPLQLCERGEAVERAEATTREGRQSRQRCRGA